MTKTIESSVDVRVPTTTAYNQWTQFETFPTFLKHVDSVRQLDDRKLHWRATIGGRSVEWDAEIAEQIPDKRIAWNGTGGAKHAGVVTFHRLDDDTCRVMLQLEYDPHGFVEKVGDFLGIPKREIEDDLKRFAQFVEARGKPTGAWRGEIASKDDEQSGEAPAH